MEHLQEPEREQALEQELEQVVVLPDNHQVQFPQPFSFLYYKNLRYLTQKYLSITRIKLRLNSFFTGLVRNVTWCSLYRDFDDVEYRGHLSKY